MAPVYRTTPTTERPNSPAKAKRRSRWDKGPGRDTDVSPKATKRGNRGGRRRSSKGRAERRNRWDQGPDADDGLSTNQDGTQKMDAGQKSSPASTAADRGFAIKGAASLKSDASNNHKTEGQELKMKEELEISEKAITAKEQELDQRSEIPAIPSTNSTPQDEDMKQGVAEVYPCGCMLMVEPIEEENPDFDIDIYGDDETRDYCRRLKRCRSHGS